LLAGNAAVRIFFVLAAILFSFYVMAQILLISAGIMALTERRLAKTTPQKPLLLDRLRDNLKKRLGL
jgi:hypothetical protein